MLQKIQSYIQKLELLTSDKPVIVGVSGGTDSVALLHILISLGYNCIIAHCNFHLRMEESDNDEMFVRTLAKKYNLPVYCIDFETLKHAETYGISIEMAARELRYTWFCQMLDKLNAQAIAIAHHADDSVETLLLNLVRGTGLRGLTGISARNNNIVRPLLCCNRSELESYLIEQQLDHVEDSTNAISDYKRNKIRNEIIPLLTEINPSIKQTLNSTIDHLNGTFEIYRQAITIITEAIVEKQADKIYLSIDIIKLQVHIPTIMYELLYPYNFNPKVILQITEHLSGESGKVFYSNTHRLIKDRNHLIINEIDDIKSSEILVSDADSVLNLPFTLAIKKMEIDSEFQISKASNCIHVDASKIHFPLTIRGWREGDYFYPFGMNKRKKVSDFLINNKLSIFEKEHVQMVLSGNDIVWIIGLRMDNRFKINENTKSVIEFSI